jgi:hypothetical protein
MASSIAIQQGKQTPQDPIHDGLVHSLRGSLTKMACKCSTKNNVDFLIKEDRIVCASCGREILCVPPVIGTYNAGCGCCSSAAVKSTFVLDSQGIYTCTWCGQKR